MSTTTDVPAEIIRQWDLEDHLEETAKYAARNHVPDWSAMARVATDPEWITAHAEEAIEAVRAAERTVYESVRDEDSWQMKPAEHLRELAGQVDDIKTGYIVAGVWMRQTIASLMAEEGDGKTMAAEQAERELLLGRKVWQHWDLGEVRIDRVLVFDLAEQTEPELGHRVAVQDERGLKVEDGAIRIAAIEDDIDLSQAGDDRRQVEALIRENVLGTRNVLLRFDAAGSAVPDPSDAVCVRGFFNWLKALMRDIPEIAGVMLIMHPRKRSGERSRGRRTFDDTFGSREWKGRPSLAIQFEGGRLQILKSRAGWLKKRSRSGKFTLLRPGYMSDDTPAFELAWESDADREDVEARAGAERDAKTRERIFTSIWEYAKERGKAPSLAALRAAVGGAKDTLDRVLDELVDEGLIERKVGSRNAVLHFPLTDRDSFEGLLK